MVLTLRRHAAYRVGVDEGANEAARPPVRVTMFVRGTVQGVGFRWWTRARALELGLVGHARNTADGRVEIVAQGSPDAVDALEALLRESPVDDPPARPRRERRRAARRSEGRDHRVRRALTRLGWPA